MAALERRHYLHKGITPGHLGFSGIQSCAVVVVEGVTLAPPVTGSSTMIMIGILLNVAGLGACCWALFTLAVYVLPFFVGMTVAIYTYQIEIGLIGASSLASSRVPSDSWPDNRCAFSHYSPCRCPVVCRSCGVCRL